MGPHAKLEAVPKTPKHDRIRQSYDAVASAYAALFGDELAYKPLDRALLTALIEQREEATPIADLGCGPGHVAAWLADHGVAAVGIDLSPQMIEIGRREHPQVDFREGDFLSLPASDAEFGAVVSFYAIIHLEPSELGRAFQEVLRTLRPSGLFLVAFHVGSEVRHLTDWRGHAVDMDFRFFEPETVVETLGESGFVVEARMERTNYPEEGDTRRGYVLARRPR
jgi:SAM-dependent methyltransferase